MVNKGISAEHNSFVHDNTHFFALSRVDTCRYEDFQTEHSLCRRHKSSGGICGFPSDLRKFPSPQPLHLEIFPLTNKRKKLVLAGEVPSDTLAKADTSVGEAGVPVVVVGKIQAELLIGEAPADVSIGEATKESSKFCPSCTGAYMSGIFTCCTSGA